MGREIPGPAKRQRVPRYTPRSVNRASTTKEPVSYTETTRQMSSRGNTKRRGCVPDGILSVAAQPFDFHFDFPLISTRSVNLQLTHGHRDGALWRSPIPPIDKRSAKSFIRTNERIRAREIRVIDENGEQLGVMAPFEALKMARERALDLVEISPNAVPPVCKIQDYGKFLYEKDKSDRAARKKQKVIVIKEVKFSVTVDEHDYQTKKNQAVRFLGDGDKVKASLRFKGRQMAHRDLGYKIINRLILDIGDAGLVEFMPRMEGTTLHAIIAPSKKAEVVVKKAVAPDAPAPAAATAPPKAASAVEVTVAEPVQS